MAQQSKGGHMPDNRGSAAETYSVMAGVLVVVAVIVGVIAYFHSGTDTSSQPASAPAPLDTTTDVDSPNR
jgi:hypothetical protein